MAAVSPEPARVPRARLDWLDLTAFWAALSIAVIWLAVLFVGVFGPSIESRNGVGDVGTGSSVPVVIIVAPCAVLATWLISRHAFRRANG